MGIFADALDDARTTGGKKLRVDEILDEIDSDDAADLRAALTSDVPVARIARALGKIGQPVSEGAIHTWRERNGSTP